MTKPKSTFREEFERQALQARKSMVGDGELLPEDEFRRRLAINDKQLARLGLATLFGWSPIVLQAIPGALARG
jgi:hypothetical protein